MDKQTDMQAYYAARAKEYDEIYLKPERQADLRAIEGWIPARFQGASLLEIACGTGYWTQFLARSADRIVGVDSSDGTLAIASHRVPGSVARFMVGDAYMLSPDLGKFDAAFAGFWMSHVPLARCQQFITGLHQHLSPGARVVFLDNRYVAGSSTPISRTDAQGNTYQTRRLKNGSTHEVLKNFPDEAALTAMIAGLGTHAKMTTWHHYWAFEYTTGA